MSKPREAAPEQESLVSDLSDEQKILLDTNLSKVLEKYSRIEKYLSSHDKNPEDQPELISVKEKIAFLQELVVVVNSLDENPEEAGKKLKKLKKKYPKSFDDLVSELSEEIKLQSKPSKLPTKDSARIIDISEIAHRVADTQAKNKLNEIENQWRTDGGRKKQQQPAQPRSFWGKIKDTTKGGWDTMKDIVKHPKDFATSCLVRLGENAYLRKFYRESLNAIESDQNLMAEIEAKVLGNSSKKTSEPDKETKSLDILDSVIEQYIVDVAKMEEKGEVVSDQDVNNKVTILFNEVVNDTIKNRKEFDARVKSEIVPLLLKKGYSFGGADPEALPKQILFANNLYQMALTRKEEIKKDIKENSTDEETKKVKEKHLKGLDALDIQLGIKRKDIKENKPREVLNWYDRLVDTMQTLPFFGKSGISSTPLAWGAASTAVALGALRAAGGAALRLTVAAPVVGSLFGGIFGAMRRSRDLQYDRGLELQRAALDVEADDRPRAREVRKYTHNIFRADDVLKKLGEINNANQTKDLTPTEFTYLANVIARLNLEDTLNIDLISATGDEGAIYGVKIKSITEILVLIRSIKEKFGLNEKNKADDLQRKINYLEEILKNNVSETNKEFEDFRRKEALKAGVFGATVGLTAGVVAESMWHTLTDGFDRSVLGKLGSWLFGADEKESLVASAGSSGPNLASQEFAIGKNKWDLHFPKNFKVNQSGETLLVTTPENVQIQLALDTDGNLTPGSLQLLRENGLSEFSTVKVEGTNQVFTGTSNVTIDDPEEMFAYLDQNYETSGPTKRVYHGNIDPRSRQTTWITNEYYDDKLTGGADQHYPYEYKADKADVKASEVSLARGETDRALAEGETVSGRLVEGKELGMRVRFDKKTNEYVLDFGPSFKNLLKNGAANLDGSVDDKLYMVKHLLAGGDSKEASEHFFFRVYVDDQHFKTGEAIKLPMNPDGTCRLDKDSELARLLIDEKGKLKLTTEVSIDNDRTDKAHILATKRGGTVDDLVIQKNTVTQELVDNNVTDTYIYETPELPTPVGDDGDDWFIPIPFVPRKAMETPEKPTGIKEVVSSLPPPPPLSKSPEAVVSSGENKTTSPLVVEKTANEQFEKVKKEITDALGGMDKNCDITVLLPFGEVSVSNMSLLVNSFLKGSKLDNVHPWFPAKDKKKIGVEIIIYQNKFTGDSDAEALRRFVDSLKDKNPNISVKFVSDKNLFEGRPPGFAIKVVTEAVVDRAERAKQDKAGEHIVANLDPKVVETVKSNWARQVLQVARPRYGKKDGKPIITKEGGPSEEKFVPKEVDESTLLPRVEVFSGTSEENKRYYKDDPHTWLFNRFESILLSKLNFPFFQKENYGFTIGAYRKSGGYTGGGTGETQELVEMLKKMIIGKNALPSKFRVPGMRVDLRDDGVNRPELEMFTKDLNALMKKLKEKSKKNPKKIQEKAEETLKFLGIDYSIDPIGGDFVIQNVDKPLDVFNQNVNLRDTRRTTVGDKASRLKSDEYKKVREEYARLYRGKKFGEARKVLLAWLKKEREGRKTTA